MVWQKKSSKVKGKVYETEVRSATMFGLETDSVNLKVAERKTFIGSYQDGRYQKWADQRDGWGEAVWRLS